MSSYVQQLDGLCQCGAELRVLFVAMWGIRARRIAPIEVYWLMKGPRQFLIFVFCCAMVRRDGPTPAKAHVPSSLRILRLHLLLLRRLDSQFVMPRTGLTVDMAHVPHSASSIALLPEEVLLQIFTYLDSEPPSLRNLREEPSLRILYSDIRPLKHSSCVSTTWRRVVLPLLFKVTRLRLDAPSPPQWLDCRVCGPVALSCRSNGTDPPSPETSVEKYHRDIVEEAMAYFEKQEHEAEGTTVSSLQLSGNIMFSWVPQLHHGLSDFLRFANANDLESKIESFVVVTEPTGPTLSSEFDCFPRAETDRGWRYRCSAAFWAHLLSTLDPTRIAILAAPMDMAFLTNCAIGTRGPRKSSIFK